MGLFLKIILRKDLLDEKIEKEKETNWEKYEPVADKSRYLKTILNGGRMGKFSLFN